MDVFASFQSFLGEAFSHQVTQFGLAFTFAAYIHARQVRKEIALQMSNVASSIDEVTKALKEDLGKQGERLIKVEDGVQKLNNRVEKLETKEIV